MDFLTRKLAGYVLCADNTTLSTAVGSGDLIRTEDRTGSGPKTPVSLIDVGGTSAEALLGDSGVAMPVRGLAAEDDAASGAPVPAGGRYDSSPRSLETGDRGEIALTSAGHQYTEVSASALPTGAATSAKQDTGNTSLASIDGKITAVNTGAVVVSSSALPSGAATSANQTTIIGHVDGIETVLGTIDADTSSLAGCVGGTEVQVDVVGSLPAGTNAIGKLAANSGVDIGDVDVTSVSGNVTVIQGTATNLKAQAEAYQGGTAVGSGNPLQVTLANGSVPSHAVTNAGTFVVQENGSALTALQVIDNPVIVDDAAFTPATSSVMMAGFQADESSTDSVNEGDAGAARITLDRKQIVTVQPHTAGGVSTFKSNDIDETEEDVKTSAGQVYFIYCVNTNASARYLKLYNATAASVTVGSTATKMDLLVPPSNSGFFLQFPTGIVFDTAISVAATTGLGDSDTGAPGANEVQVTIGYV